ncbi:hypothetical protein C8R47DRAFT_1068089 [Mycena vitilis]|nr:hypothetical protein C8R47DRAFT_1068089 [Mycena vitilis]
MLSLAPLAIRIQKELLPAPAGSNFLLLVSFHTLGTQKELPAPAGSNFLLRGSLHTLGTQKEYAAKTRHRRLGSPHPLGQTSYSVRLVEISGTDDSLLPNPARAQPRWPLTNVNNIATPGSAAAINSRFRHNSTRRFCLPLRVPARRFPPRASGDFDIIVLSKIREKVKALCRRLETWTKGESGRESMIGAAGTMKQLRRTNRKQLHAREEEATQFGTGDLRGHRSPL